MLERFGYSGETAFAVGLTCGGVIDILIAPVRATELGRETLASVLSAACSGETVALARVVDGPAELMGRGLVVRATGASEGTLGDEVEVTRTAVAETRAMLLAGRTGTVGVGGEGSSCPQPLTFLVESSAPPPRLIVFGAIDFAAALVRLGKFAATTSPCATHGRHSPPGRVSRKQTR